MLLELSSSVLSQSESSGLRPCEEEQKRSEGRGLSSSALTNTGGFDTTAYRLFTSCSKALC